MSAIGLFYTREGIVAITGKEAVDAAIFRMRDLLASGEAYGVAANLSNKAAPIISTWNDAALMKELMATAGRADWNEYAKESFAAVLGTLAGVVALPAGPTASLAADMAMSKVYKGAHDAASNYSRSLNWDPVFDRIHNNIDYLNRVFGEVDYHPAGVADRIRPVGVVQLADSPAVEMPNASGAEKFSNPHMQPHPPSSSLVSSSSDHTVTLTPGSTLSDIVLLQSRAGNPITVSDVLTANPKYTDASKIPAGAELNVPVRSGDKLSIYRADGSVETINTRPTANTPSTSDAQRHTQDGESGGPHSLGPYGQPSGTPTRPAGESKVEQRSEQNGDRLSLDTSGLSPVSRQLLADSEREVAQVAQRHGLPWNQGLSNTCCSVAAAAREAGMTRLNLFKADGGLISFGQYDGRTIRERELDAVAAANVPQAESLQRLGQADRQVQGERERAQESASEVSWSRFEMHEQQQRARAM